MKTRIIYTKFWEDEYILSLTPKEKVLYNFYLTNSSVGLTGIYEIAGHLISVFTGLTSKEIEDANQKFMEANKIVFYKSWVKIVNASKYQDFSGEKNEKAKEKELSHIPNSVLEELDSVSIGYQGVSTTGDTLNNHKSLIINQKSEKEEVVKEKPESSMAYLVSIPIADLEEFVAKFIVSKPQAISKGKEVYDSLLSRNKTKTYTDYKALLRNIFRRDFGERPTKESIGSKYVINEQGIATLPGGTNL